MPQEKLAVDVAAGHLVVVLCVVVAVIFLARHWTVPAEDELNGEASEQSGRPIGRAAEGYASDFGRTYPRSAAQPGPSSAHSQANDSVASAPVGNLR